MLHLEIEQHEFLIDDDNSKQNDTSREETGNESSIESG